MILLPNFVPDHISLHSYLWNEIPFVRHSDRPRSECWMNDFDLPYTYGKGKGSKTYEASPWNGRIRLLRNEISQKFGFLDSCFINGYLNGSDSLGWHSDDSPEMDDSRGIAVISLGAEREIWFRKKGAKGEAEDKISLPSGSILWMPPGMQDTHEHRIPKSKLHKCPPRISLTFRGLVR